jgi:hypothetical protein
MFPNFSNKSDLTQVLTLPGSPRTFVAVASSLFVWAQELFRSGMRCTAAEVSLLRIWRCCMSRYFTCSCSEDGHEHCSVLSEKSSMIFRNGNVLLSVHLLHKVNRDRSQDAPFPSTAVHNTLFQNRRLPEGTSLALRFSVRCFNSLAIAGHKIQEPGHAV